VSLAVPTPRFKVRQAQKGAEYVSSGRKPWLGNITSESRREDRKLAGIAMHKKCVDCPNPGDRLSELESRSGVATT